MRRYFVNIMILVFFCLDLSAQSKSITGKVLDESGQPMLGVTIVERGTSNGTTTSLNGIFKLALKGVDPTLDFTMIGYTPVSVKVKNETNITISMSTTSEAIEEVVVVGYGTQTKTSVTGSIATMDSDDIKKSPALNIASSLTGRISGVVTQQSSGRPGVDDPTIFIRGRSSMSGDNEPLVLVDGIERSFAQIDSDDIDNISVLKDASATAVYGVRGANGVILVTTKRGKTGKVDIAFSAEYGVQKVMRLPNKVDSWQHAVLSNEGSINDGFTPMYTEEDIKKYASGGNPFTHPNVNYMKTFIVPAPQQKYNVNVSGGTDNIRYFVSVGYTHQLGIFQTDVNKLKKRGSLKELIDLKPELSDMLYVPDYTARHQYDRMNIRSNIDIDITKNLSLGLDLGFRNELINGPGGSRENNEYLYGVFGRTPNMSPLLNENGTFAAPHGSAANTNPLVTTAYEGFMKQAKNALEATLKLKYQFKGVKGLNLGGKFSINSYSHSHRFVNEIPDVWQYNYRTDTYTCLRNATARSAGNKVYPAQRKIYGELSLGYKNNFGDHHLSGVLLIQIDSKVKPTLENSMYNNIPQIYQGIVGRVNYDYQNKYLFEANFGYNGSNRFEKGNRYAFFPAGSVGWVLTKEKFMEKLSKIINYLKIRASYGQVGNDKLGSGFEYYNEAIFESGRGYNFGTNPSGYYGLKEGLGINSYVTWEKATKYNLGLETKWYKGHLSIDADFFYEKRTNILATPGQYLFAAGVSKYPKLNLGEVENKGLEIEVKWNHHIGKLNYYVQGMYSFARNKILDMNEQLRQYDYMRRTGKRIGQYFGLLDQGLFQSYEQIASSATQSGVLQPGDVKYRDINGDGIIDEKDIAAFGFSNIPEIVYSATIGFDIYGFAVSAMFQGAANVTVYMDKDLGYEFFNYGTAMKYRHLDRWTPETAAKATYHRMAQSSNEADNNFQYSSFYSVSGNYIRLKNLEFSYTFPKKLLKKTPIASLKIYGSGFNLVTWDKLKIVDPESRRDRQNFYPQTKVFNFGIKITF